MNLSQIKSHKTKTPKSWFYNDNINFKIVNSSKLIIKYKITTISNQVPCQLIYSKVSHMTKTSKKKPKYKNTKFNQLKSNATN